MKINTAQGIEKSDRASWGNAFVCAQNTPESLTGKIFEVLELAGLTEKQEESAKRLIRKIIWETFSRDGVLIGEKTHTSIKEKNYRDSRSSGLTPATEIV